jgi:hypothetical protein
MKKFLYGEGRKFHKGALTLLIVGKPVHLQGVHRALLLEVRIAYPDETIGISGRLEDSPCGL